MKELKILIVEDSMPDALLMLVKIQKNDFKTIHKIVDTQEELLDALKVRKWDVVLCDYKMPQLSCSRVLAWVRQQDQRVPFILVSGAMDDKSVAVMLNAGANAYVKKDKMDNLASVIDWQLLRVGMASRAPLRQEFSEQVHKTLD